MTWRVLVRTNWLRFRDVSPLQARLDVALTDIKTCQNAGGLAGAFAITADTKLIAKRNQYREELRQLEAWRATPRAEWNNRNFVFGEFHLGPLEEADKVATVRYGPTGELTAEMDGMGIRLLRREQSVEEPKSGLQLIHAQLPENQATADATSDDRISANNAERAVHCPGRRIGSARTSPSKVPIREPRMTARPENAETERFPLGFVEFVGLVAAMIAMTAFSIDIMLPAFPAIAEALNVASANDRQEIITAYMIGFAAGQIVYGPVSDTFGRRPVAFFGFMIFALATLAAAFAQSFPALLAARAAQGIGAAAPRIMALAIVRDRFSGDRMARVMSLVMVVFIVVPVVAPSIGQLILFVGPWRWVFGFLLAFGIAVAAWAFLRLPETLSAANRRPLRLGSVLEAIATAVTTRQTLGYGTAMGLIFGALMTYLGTAQQILGELYGLDRWFPVAFGISALAFAAASYSNSRLVMRLGARRLSHTALLAFIAVTGATATLALAGNPSFPAYFALGSLAMFLFGLIGPNFNAIAMEPLGRIAGTAASFVGAFSTIVSALAGWYIGRQFDGTVAPVAIGFVTLGIASLAVVLVTERGRLLLKT